MDTVLVSDNYHFFYDPYLYGYNTSWFKTISGSALAIAGKIRINTGRVSSLGTYLLGDFEMKLTIPTAPTGGDSRVFGLYSQALGNRNAAYFFISGTNFYVRSYSNDSAVAEQTMNLAF